MITNFYIDASDPYFGPCPSTPYELTDLAKLMGLVSPRNQIGQIRYFTARVLPEPGDLGQYLDLVRYGFRYDWAT